MTARCPQSGVPFTDADYDRDYLEVVEGAESTYGKWSTDRDWR